MTLFRLKSAPFVLIEDHGNNNILPLLVDLVQDEKEQLYIVCYEQPYSLWRNIIKNLCKINYCNRFDHNILHKYVNTKTSIIIDSVNQMALSMGWKECLKCIKALQNSPNVNRLILVLHKDCLMHGSKLKVYLNHIANVIIVYSKINPQNVHVSIKKGNKVIRSEETISYDTHMSMLKLIPVIKQEKKEEQQEKLLPTNLSTFKIEVEQTDMIQKYNLKLPYMSKIHDGQSKVYYEPDSVDDWDEEDPDEDLDI